MFVDISGSWEDLTQSFLIGFKFLSQPSRSLLGLNFFHSSRNTLKNSFAVLQKSVKKFGSGDSLGTNVVIQKMIGNFPAEKYCSKS